MFNFHSDVSREAQRINPGTESVRSLSSLKKGRLIRESFRSCIYCIGVGRFRILGGGQGLEYWGSQCLEYWGAKV